MAARDTLDPSSGCDPVGHAGTPSPLPTDQGILSPADTSEAQRDMDDETGSARGSQVAFTVLRTGSSDDTESRPTSARRRRQPSIPSGGDAKKSRGLPGSGAAAVSANASASCLHCADKTAAADTLSAELARLRTALSTASATTVAAEARVEAARMQLQHHEQQLLRLKELELGRELLESQVVAAKGVLAATVQQLQAEHATAMDAAQTVLARARVDHAAAVAALRSQADTAEAKARELDASVAEFTRQAASWSNERTQLQSDLALARTQHTDSAAALQREVDDLRAGVAARDKALAVAGSEHASVLAAVQSELAQLRVSGSEAQDAAKEQQQRGEQAQLALQSRINVLEEQLAVSLTAQTGATEEHAATLQASQAQAAAALLAADGVATLQKQQLASLTEQLAAATTAHAAALQATQEAATRATSDVKRQHDETIAASAQQQSALKARVTSLTEELAAVRAATAAQFNEAATRAVAAQEELQKRLDASTAAVATAASEHAAVVARLTVDHETLARKEEESRAAREQLTQELQQHTRDLAAAREAVARLESERTAPPVGDGEPVETEELRVLRGEMATLVAQAAAAGTPSHASLATAVQRALDLAAAAEGSCARLQQQVVDSAGEASTLADQVRTLQRDDAALRRRLEKVRKHAPEPAATTTTTTTTVVDSPEHRDMASNTDPALLAPALVSTSGPAPTTGTTPLPSTGPGGYVRAVSETSGLVDAATWERRCRELQDRCVGAETQLHVLQQQAEPEIAAKYRALSAELDRVRFERESLDHVVQMKTAEGRDLRARIALLERQHSTAVTLQDEIKRLKAHEEELEIALSLRKETHDSIAADLLRARETTQAKEEENRRLLAERDELMWRLSTGGGVPPPRMTPVAAVAAAPPTFSPSFAPSSPVTEHSSIGLRAPQSPVRRSNSLRASKPGATFG